MAGPCVGVGGLSIHTPLPVMRYVIYTQCVSHGRNVCVEQPSLSYIRYVI